MARIAADASVFYAIADPTRRAILDLLREGERTVTAMMDTLGSARRLTQSAFSQHLAVLRRVGLVLVRPDGRERVYSFNAAPLAEVVDWVGPYEKFWTDRLDRLGSYLDRRHAGTRPRAPITGAGPLSPSPRRAKRSGDSP